MARGRAAEGIVLADQWPVQLQPVRPRSVPDRLHVFLSLMLVIALASIYA
jgi:hypothetical protein